MIAAQAAHHRAAPKARAHDGATHRIPAVHERQRARGIGADALDRCPLGPKRREVVADAAALLHGERRFLQVLEDRGHVVSDPAHHEAVEERDLPLGTGTGEDAAGGQELEPLQRAVERGLPAPGLRLDRRERTGHPPPAILDRAVDGRAVGLLQPVLHVPDPGRDRQHVGSWRASCSPTAFHRLEAPICSMFVSHSTHSTRTALFVQYWDGRITLSPATCHRKLNHRMRRNPGACVASKPRVGEYSCDTPRFTYRRAPCPWAGFRCGRRYRAGASARFGRGGARCVRRSGAGGARGRAAPSRRDG